MKKILAASIVLILFTICVHFDVRAEEPEEYTVQEGDTLWGISDTKLDDNFLWPKLWNVNPHIEDPDLIYPGIHIRIPTKEELMRMAPPPMKKRPFTYKPKPKKKVEKHTFLHPKEKINKYLLDKIRFISSGWISDTYPSVGEIEYSPMDRRLVGEGDTVYLRLNNKALNEKIFYTIRDVKIVKHPVTDKMIGHQIKITGILKVIGMDDKSPKAEITASYEEIHIGDGLLPYKDLDPPVISKESRTPDINGYIIESHLNNYLVAEGDIIYLDKGERDGLAVGDSFSVFSDSGVKRVHGKIKIVSLQQKTANALIVEGNQEMFLGSEWGQK